VSSTLRALAREPVIHFAIIGALLFGLDAVISRSETADSGDAASQRPFAGPQGPIVVDASVQAMLTEHWLRTHASPPTEAELEALVDAWIDDEALYREGLARGLAENDPQIRERVVSQMAYVLQSRITVPTATDDELRAWFETHAERYAQPERVDFTQVFVDGLDDAAQARARELLRLLEGGADPNGLGDTFAGGRRFRGRRLADLAGRFGEAFTTGVDAQPPGTWTLRRSTLGLHLVRIDRWTSSATPDFESARAEILHDWEQGQRETALAAAKQALRSQWEVLTSP